jgi:hypothetical protein
VRFITTRSMANAKISAAYQFFFSSVPRLRGVPT